MCCGGTWLCVCFACVCWNVCLSIPTSMKETPRFEFENQSINSKQTNMCTRLLVPASKLSLACFYERLFIPLATNSKSDLSKQSTLWQPGGPSSRQQLIQSMWCVFKPNCNEVMLIWPDLLDPFPFCLPVPWASGLPWVVSNAVGFIYYLQASLYLIHPPFIALLHTLYCRVFSSMK